MSLSAAFLSEEVPTLVSVQRPPWSSCYFALAPELSQMGAIKGFGANEVMSENVRELLDFQNIFFLILEQSSPFKKILCVLGWGVVLTVEGEFTYVMLSNPISTLC